MELSNQEQQICNEVDALQTKALDMLSELVEFNSQLGHEQSAQNYMANHFKQMGLTVDRFEVDHEKIKHLPGYSPSLIDYQGRENVVGIYQPGQTAENSRSLILNGHIDVVPTGPLEKWQGHPFKARLDGDKLYGRGSGDMKAGLVAYCIAFEAIKSAGLRPCAPLYLQSVIEEECTGNGALACLHRGYRADAAIIPEPFEQKLMIAQLGVMWLTITVSGHPAHVLDTSTGSNAIEAAYSIFRKLKKLEKNWNLAENRHASYADHIHPINFNLGQIKGGDWTSTVPTQCEMDVRIGFYPQVELDEVKTQLEHCISEAVSQLNRQNQIEVAINYRGFQAQGFIADQRDALFDMLAAVHRSISHIKLKPLASTATTDARFFHLYGDIPATCYGPIAGNIHSFNEWVSISSMIEVSKILAVFISRWCKLDAA